MQTESASFCSEDTEKDSHAQLSSLRTSFFMINALSEDQLVIRTGDSTFTALRNVKKRKITNKWLVLTFTFCQ